VGKYATRVSFLTGLLVEAFPDVSKSGDTQAKPEVWSNRADFDKRVKDFWRPRRGVIAGRRTRRR
jgi:cytochrome c556